MAISVSCACLKPNWCMSPAVLSLTIMSPKVLSLTIKSPTVLSLTVMGPRVLSLTIKSPAVVLLTIKSPVVLLLTVKSHAVASLTVKSPAVLSVGHTSASPQNGLTVTVAASSSGKLLEKPPSMYRTPFMVSGLYPLNPGMKEEHSRACNGIVTGPEMSHWN